MGDTIYAYKGKYWKVLHNFQYTGEAVPFTLNPGKYLLICHGAQGGLTQHETASINYGGVAYGVLDLKETKEMYAVVGGNGGSAIDMSTPGVGGFNGGGNGGYSYNNSYITGAGGGGASDIRLLPDDGTIIDSYDELKVPDEYKCVEYIESTTGSEYINTGVISPFSVTMDIQFTKSNTRQLMGIGLSTGQYFGATASNTIELDNGTDFDNSNTTERNVITYTHNVSNASLSWNDQTLTSASSSTSSPLLIGRASLTDTSFNCSLRIYSIIVKNNTTDDMLRYFVPCYRIEDNVSGLYDIINSVFYENAGSGSYIFGEETESPVIKRPVSFNKSCLSRLIVAGGGGGSSNMNYDFRYAGNGGGIVGGFVESGSTSENHHLYADQMSGYNFGEGMTPVTKTNMVPFGAEGASGGGGGWFGGYANGSSNIENSSSNGGGGSGYVLTADSYKPEGYLLGEEYYLTDTFMCGAAAINPQILVCTPVDIFNMNDTIIFPCIGETEHVILPTGKFRLKCYGGDGGCRYILSETRRGGYAEGVLDNKRPVDIFVNVGGSGTGTSMLSAEYSNMNYPTAMFNGGGAPGNVGSIGGCAGGGGTDIRIGSDSLYSRIIVAGGAGGNAKYLAGAGGGESGEKHANSGRGTNSGPGTQKESPQNTTYQTINGGFGFGGNGVNANNGYGGAGGGGWYGGSGTYPDGSDDDKGGSGGSGYVLTADSYKPEGYLLGEEYYLTDTVLTTGGNTLPIGHTEVVIEVLECSFVWLLCHDAEGYKRFDEETQQWIAFSQTISPDLFEKYGSFNITSDVGLLDKYDIVVYDPKDSLEAIDMNIIPTEQLISRTVNQSMIVSRIIEDCEYNPDVYSIRSETIRTGIGSNSKITLNTYISKKQESDEKLRLYCTQIYSK